MTDGPNPTFRLAGVEDAPAMLEVIEAAFDSWPPIQVNATPLDHLRWKMTPPDLNPPHDLLEIDGRIAGARVQWWSHLQLAGRDFIAEAGADFGIHPDFQGRGLSRLITEHVRQRRLKHPVPGISFLSNAPQIRHMNEPDFIERTVYTWFRPFGPRPFATVHLREGGPLQLARAAAARVRARTHALPAGARIEVLERFDDRADALWERARRAYDIIFFRRAAYLNWRFQRPESGDHVILGLLRGDALLGYAVVKRSWDQGDLMDLLYDPDEPAAPAALIDAAIARLRHLGANGVTSWLPAGHEIEPTLRRAGFAVVGTQTLLLGSPANGETPPEAIEVLRDLTRPMHVTMSDFDHA